MAAGQQEDSQQQVRQGLAGSENGQQLNPASLEDVWDEERLEKAMKTLKEMHIQVCYLYLPLITCSSCSCSIAPRLENYDSKTYCAFNNQTTIA
jgi:hypothetical protein